jgi:FAD:protein FMN transferase
MAVFPPPPVVLARHAMATRFEIALHGSDPVALRAAGEEALDEIERLESRLSLYQPTSEIARVNAGAARAPVRVSPDVFRLLEHAQRLHHETAGAFDMTIAPLVRCWGFMGGHGQMPSPEEMAEARAAVGMRFVELDPQHSTVRFARDGVMLDLGALGKGYAIDCAAEILRESGVTSALLHGGTSTTYAIGCPPREETWKVGIDWGERRTGVSPVPEDATRSAEEARPGSTTLGSSTDRRDVCPTLIAVVPLRDESLSVSAVWGRAFESGGRLYGHVIDPGTGEPVMGAWLAAVVVPLAADSDALSTALLTLGTAGLEVITPSRPNSRALVVERREGRPFIVAQGIETRLPCETGRGTGSA